MSGEVNVVDGKKPFDVRKAQDESAEVARKASRKAYDDSIASGRKHNAAANWARETYDTVFTETYEAIRAANKLKPSNPQGDNNER